MTEESPLTDAIGKLERAIELYHWEEVENQKLVNALRKIAMHGSFIEGELNHKEICELYIEIATKALAEYEVAKQDYE